MSKKISVLSIYAILCCILAGCEFYDTPLRTWEHSGLGSYDAKLSPDGRLALIATVDHGTHLWDMDQDKSLFMFTDEAGQKTPHQVLALTPPVAITAFEDQCVIWNTQNAQSLAFWKMPAKILDISLTDDGRFALFGMSNGQAHLIDLSTGFTFKVFEHADNINSVTFSSNEQYVLIGSDDTAARLWDLNTGEMVHQWFHDKKITFVSISPNNDFALISSAQNSTEIKNIKNGQTHLKLNLDKFPYNVLSNQIATITSAVFSHDGKYLFTGSPPRHIHKWRVEDGALLAKWVLPTKRGKPNAAIPFSIAITKDNELRIEASNGRGYAYQASLVSTSKL